jgi:hypothetical protein
VLLIDDRDDTELADPQALIAEARRRTRRRCMRQASAVVLIAGLAAAVVAIVGGGWHGWLGESSSQPGGGPASAASASPRQPVSIAALADGGVAIADDARNEILERSPSGRYKVIAGTGRPGFTGDGGPAIRAEVRSPGSLLATSSGALYFVQPGPKNTSSVIREITPNGMIRTLAGLHPTCSGDRGATSVPAQSALMPGGASLSLGPRGVIEVSTTICPNIYRLGTYFELTPSGQLTENQPDKLGAALADCTVAAGTGFLAFGCESGGAAVGQPHPKELLVVRSNGSTKAYHTIGGEQDFLTVGDGQVIAVHSYSVVRVTSRTITTLVSERQLAHFFRGARVVAGINGITVNSTGDVYLTAGVYLPKRGCGALIVERTTTGALRKLWSATSTLCY